MAPALAGRPGRAFNRGMSEIEVPLEKAQEDILEAAHERAHERDRNTGRAAVASAVLAVLAAISALLAGHFANEAMIDQIKSANAWNYYQAKGIKLAIAEMRGEQAGAAPAVREKIEQYHHDQEKIREEAQEKEGAAARHLKRHETFAGGVTLFQIGIALTAIALLTRRRHFQTVAYLAGLAGLGFLVFGLFGGG